jgi:predicted metal-dependent hydrolase
MDNRTINEYYAEIGNDLIQMEDALVDILNSQVTIIYLSSEHRKISSGKKILGQCEKVADKYKWGIPCDFTITVFEPNVEGMSEEQLRMLIFHELLHVGIEYNADGTETYSIKPHDLEDFKLIIDRFGTDWSKTDEEENR